MSVRSRQSADWEPCAPSPCYSLVDKELNLRLLSTVNFLTKLLPDFERRTQSKVADKRATSVCIIGDGLYGLAVASLLSGRCKKLNVIRIGRSKPLEESSFPLYGGHGGGEHRDSLESLRAMVFEPNAAVSSADHVIFAGNLCAYDEYVPFVQTYLRDGQNLVFVNAPIGAGLQFVEVLNRAGLNRKFNIAEVGDLFYGVRVESDNLLMSSVRPRANLAGITRNQLRRNIAIDSLLPMELIPSSNVIERGLFEVERVLRPTLLLIGILAESGSEGSPFGLANTVFNTATLSLLSKLEMELAAIGKAYKSVAPTFVNFDDSSRNGRKKEKSAAQLKTIRETIDSYYSSLMRSISLAGNPPQQARKIITNDLCEHVVILSELAGVARIDSPALNSLIDFASSVSHVDIRRHARSLSDLGVRGFGLHEIVELVNA
jgi:hypothetical protein